MSGERKYRDEEWLREQYVEDQRSTRDIAEDCGCSKTTVRRWLEKHDIEPRAARRRLPDQRLIDPEWLREQYVEKQRTTTGIAEDLECSAKTVSNWLNRHGVETRGPGDQTPDRRLTDFEWLREQYVKQQRSTYDIAEDCGCHASTVKRWLGKHDIEARLPSDRAPEQLTDPGWLREQYAEQRRSTTDIADECGCSANTVRKWLGKHDIETRVPVGENHPDWDGGPAPYGPGWNKRKRRAVRERDDHTCQDPRCAVTQSEHLGKHDEKLHVHHLRKARDVDDPEKRNANENLITLCRDCHERWEKMADAGLVPEVKV